MRLAVAHLSPIVPLAGVVDVVLNHHDYERMLENGADVWRNWRTKRTEQLRRVERDLEQTQKLAGQTPPELIGSLINDIKQLSTRRDNLRSDFMLASEVAEASEYVARFLASNEIATHECSGFWACDAVDFGTREQLGEEVKSLLDALDSEQEAGPFAAVLTISGSSMCVAYVGNDPATEQPVWFIFDSHGTDEPGRSTLAQLPSSAAVMHVVSNTFEHRELSDTDNEFVRMRTNSYSMFILRATKQ